MIHSCRVRNARHIDSYQGTAKPADRQRNLTGLFVHTAVMELMTRIEHKQGPIANVGFVIGADAVAGGSVREI